MKYKVFVDGSEGTTGLKINERLISHEFIEILKIPDELRKDVNTRKEFINNSDIAILCLPDAAAKEAVSLAENKSTRIIDASTAHRTAETFAYGFPELSEKHKEDIKKAKFVTVPGCHATGFTAAVYPLITGGIMGKDCPLVCQSVTGYSGGGKALIEKYEKNRTDDISLKSPQFYALSLMHKHLPEMQKINGLASPPLFTPIVGDFYNGMNVSLPLNSKLLNKKMSAKDIHSFLSDYYAGQTFIKVMPFGGEGALVNGFLDATSCNGTNRLEIFVFGHNEQILIISRLDNLGKGASGAAIQCMNIMLGIKENTALTIDN